MLYLGNASSESVRLAMREGRIGMLATPAEGRSPAEYPVWAADNGCFGKGYPGDLGYLDWLKKLRSHAPRCLFATAPDVLGDPVATLARSQPILPRIRKLGYPAALVGQDGLENLDVPWDEFDVLFIGGTSRWKLSVEVADLLGEAKLRDKTAHVGRVNSDKRYRYFESLGVDSCDGTFLARGPDQNLIRQSKWGWNGVPPQEVMF